MNIGINARVLTERKGGPYRYTVNVLRELSQIDRKNNYFLFVNDECDPGFALPANFQIIIKHTSSKIYFDYVYLPYISLKKNIDVWFFPKNTFCPMIRGKKIAVFHDIVYFEKLGFREFNFFDNLHHTIMIPISGNFSFMNIAVSEYTALRMKELLKIPEARISIIKEGVEDKFCIISDRKILKKVQKRYGLRIPFFFYAGSLSPRKNMIGLLKAFNEIKEKIPHVIYYTGGYSWRDNEVLRFIDSHNLGSRVIKLGYVSDDDLVAIYNLADGYLYPSLYEGFGLPILEAQACGCPVITSTEASCPEVAGKGAIFVDPRNTAQIANAMIELSLKRALRKKIVQAGFANVKQYSWRRCAEQILEIFEDAAKK